MSVQNFRLYGPLVPIIWPSWGSWNFTVFCDFWVFLVVWTEFCCQTFSKYFRERISYPNKFKKFIFIPHQNSRKNFIPRSNPFCPYAILNDCSLNIVENWLGVHRVQKAQFAFVRYHHLKFSMSISLGNCTVVFKFSHSIGLANLHIW